MTNSTNQAYKDFLGQNYEKIKAECLKENKLFVDDLFPADNTSLFKFNNKHALNVTWRRPLEILKNKPVYQPVFVKDSISSSDVCQGDLGNHWFISAVSEVCKEREYIRKVIPVEGQTFENGKYAGIFRFRFWRNGEWVEVVVDDFLPVHEDNSLKFCRNNKDECEMYAPLLEKAYAKLNGCYEFLDGGDIVDALIEMTGGIHERIKLKNNIPENILWEVLSKSFEMKSLAGASSNGTPMGDIQKLDNGLSMGHAYSVMEVFELIIANKQVSVHRPGSGSLFENKDPNRNVVRLLKLKNPWAQKEIYNGPWGPKSQEWQELTDSVKKNLSYNNESKDNEFYMLYDNFIKIFDNLDFVHVNLNAFYTKTSDYNFDVNWKNKDFFGSWIVGQNAGGCGNENKADFWSNPQFNLTLKLENKNDDKVSLIVFLMQTDDIVKRRTETNGMYIGSNYAINFAVFKIKANVPEGNAYTAEQLDKVGEACDSYLPHKSISARFNLEPGKYVIIPSTFDKNKASTFLLRTFMEGTAQSKIVKYTKKIDDKAEKLIEKLPENTVSNKAKDVYHKAQDNLINPAGAVVSRACLLM